MLADAHSSAIEAALPEYRRFPALREMHSTNAIGKVTDISVKDGITAITALIVSSEAIRKIRHGVLRAFPVGGKVLARDERNPKIIAKMRLTEISCVDVPCNGDAVMITKAVGFGFKAEPNGRSDQGGAGPLAAGRT